VNNEYELSKLRYFPVTIFSIVMGLSGITIAFYRAFHLRWLPAWPYLSLLFFVTFLFFFFLFLYGLKMVRYPDEVKKEYHHRVKINFFSAISISFLLISIAWFGYMPFVSLTLWYAGVIGHTFLTFKTMTFWIRGDFELNNVNPAWFIPVVGNLIVPVIGADLVPAGLNVYFLFTGIFFWIILFAIVLYRLIFHHQLAARFIPTMFILMAPPAVIFISYYRIFMNIDVFSLAMAVFSLFFAVLLLFLVKDFFSIEFYISWWAYTFPLSAVSISFMIAYQVTGNLFFMYVSIVTLVITAIVIGIVLYNTLKHALHGKICVMED